VTEEYNLSEEQQRAIAEIFLWRSRFLFGLILRGILDDTGISHRKWGKRALEYDKWLKDKRFRYPKSKMGYLGHVGIHRILTAEAPPTYAQCHILFSVIEQHIGQEKFPRELQADLWHLGLFGTPGEVYFAYERYKHLIDESSHEFIAAKEEHERKMREGMEEGK
jgi:hypothetical protein